MADLPEIDVQIDRMGKVSVEVRGVSGKKCEALTAALEKALGGAVVERRYKDAYYQEDVTVVGQDRLSTRI